VNALSKTAARTSAADQIAAFVRDAGCALTATEIANSGMVASHVAGMSVVLGPSKAYMVAPHLKRLLRDGLVVEEKIDGRLHYVWAADAGAVRLEVAYLEFLLTLADV
jgi:hypothetical protein